MLPSLKSLLVRAPDTAHSLLRLPLRRSYPSSEDGAGGEAEWRRKAGPCVEDSYPFSPGIGVSLGSGLRKYPLLDPLKPRPKRPPPHFPAPSVEGPALYLQLSPFLLRPHGQAHAPAFPEADLPWS